MKLIFAQGNPGDQYVRTRHNAGFIVLDSIANAQNTDWKTDTKVEATIAVLTLDGEKVLLVKPLSFYNETGQVARALVDFFKLDPINDVLVIHDELALPFGTVRVRTKGSDAGNNGVKSLNAHLGPDYSRIRIGIWNEQRDLMDDAAFVLSKFSEDEAKQLQELIDTKISALVKDFISGRLEATSHTHSS
ncbi:MAG: aminoacyl-tRNA hydrolase [Candidatus Saccharimonadaceae bacterium]